MRWTPSLIRSNEEKKSKPPKLLSRQKRDFFISVGYHFHPLVSIDMKWWLLLYLSLVGACIQKPQSIQAPVLYIQPFHDADSLLVLSIAAAIQSASDFHVTLLPPVKAQAQTIDPVRNRYWASRLLDQLKPTINKKDQFVLGITGTDMAIAKADGSSWGIMGLAYLNRSVAVVSSFRPKRRGASLEKVKERMVLLALHELGHAQGLDHCKNSTCLMRDAEGKMHVDDCKSYCKTCFQYLNDRGFIQKRGIYSQLTENK